MNRTFSQFPEETVKTTSACGGKRAAHLRRLCRNSEKQGAAKLQRRRVPAGFGLPLPRNMAGTEAGPTLALNYKDGNAGNIDCGSGFPAAICTTALK